jgi:hypothetical protein
MDGGDPAERLKARAAEEEDFDWSAELANFRRSGFDLALPIVDRSERVAGLIRAAGWDGANALTDATFVGYEVEFLATYLLWTEGE